MALLSKRSPTFGLERAAHIPSHSHPQHWSSGAGTSGRGTMVFVPLGLRNGSWTSHHGVAGCGSLQKGRWPTSSWRTGPQVKAREVCVVPYLPLCEGMGGPSLAKPLRDRGALSWKSKARVYLQAASIPPAFSLKGSISCQAPVLLGILKKILILEPRERRHAGWSQVGSSGACLEDKPSEDA